MRLAIILLTASALSAFTYLWLERLGRQAWLAMSCRAIAWGALGILLVDLSCGVPERTHSRPIVLLDASLSLRAAGGRWAEARDSAERWGEVRLFGDERADQDTVPGRGRSLLGPALAAGSAAGRPLIVVSDGEIEDATDLPSDLLSATRIRLFPRSMGRDIAITRVAGPARVTAGDTLTLDVELRANGTTPGDSVRLELRGERGVILRRSVHLASEGLAETRLTIPSASLGAGDHILEVAIVAPKDDEPRDDVRLHLVTVTPTPGITLLASPADWDSRFLYRALKDVAQLPVRGYVGLDPGRWRSMGDLSVVTSNDVRQAARQAVLLVAKGGVSDLVRESHARGVWLWPSGEGGESVLAGDWYLSAGSSSPIAGAFVGLPVDSFPPAFQITPIEPGPGDWVALSAQEGRRGAERAVMIGRDSAGHRRVTVAVDGLWRWAFRGGSSAEAYRAWVAATVSWLLGGADAVRGRAQPVRPVVPNARPVVFAWSGPGAPAPLAVDVEGAGATRRDTLRFDGGGHGALWLPVGRYHYRLEGGGEGTLAVEEYSDEWLPRTVALHEQTSPGLESAARTNARQWVWLFGLCVAALSGEWWGRKRLGLR